VERAVREPLESRWRAGGEPLESRQRAARRGRGHGLVGTNRRDDEHARPDFNPDGGPGLDPGLDSDLP
jgi:hypothetical protein